jgi:hypothetical protein
VCVHVCVSARQRIRMGCACACEPYRWLTTKCHSLSASQSSRMTSKCTLRDACMCVCKRVGARERVCARACVSVCACMCVGACVCAFSRAGPYPMARRLAAHVRYARVRPCTHAHAHAHALACPSTHTHAHTLQMPGLAQRRPICSSCYLTIKHHCQWVLVGVQCVTACTPVWHFISIRIRLRLLQRAQWRRSPLPC